MKTEESQRAIIGAKVTVSKDIIPDRREASGIFSYIKEAWPDRKAGAATAG